MFVYILFEYYQIITFCSARILTIVEQCVFASKTITQPSNAFSVCTCGILQFPAGRVGAGYLCYIKSSFGSLLLSNKDGRG